VIKRTIEISNAPAHLAVKLDQLLVKRNGDTVGSIPVEDIGVVMVDHPGTTYSHAALGRLADQGAVVVICGPNHLPAAILLPLADHSQVVWRIHDQLGVTAPVRKQLWKQLVQAKIRGQARNLPADCSGRSKLLDLARCVKSGDPANVEARAARVYWQYWLPEEPFRRNPKAQGVNSFLNYGYAVVRAAVARTIVAAGLLPALGLHHSNRGNSFCLADDLVEPLRPMVDDRVHNLIELGHVDLTQEAKAALLELLTDRVKMGDETGPMMVKLHQMTASLLRCYRGESKRLEIPESCT